MMMQKPYNSIPIICSGTSTFFWVQRLYVHQLHNWFNPDCHPVWMRSEPLDNDSPYVRHRVQQRNPCRIPVFSSRTTSNRGICRLKQMGIDATGAGKMHYEVSFSCVQWMICYICCFSLSKYKCTSGFKREPSQHTIRVALLLGSLIVAQNTMITLET